MNLRQVMMSFKDFEGTVSHCFDTAVAAPPWFQFEMLNL